MSSNLSVWVLAALVTLLGVASLSFAVDVSGDTQPEPVRFAETVEVGMTGAETVRAENRGLAIPRAEVFYSQYRYVVGYYGVSTLVDDLGRPGHEKQFGRPMTVWVSDFSPEQVTLTDSSMLNVTTGTVDTWVLAGEAHFVVESRARTPSGPAVVPFSDRADAVAFADRYGGEVRRWEGVRELSFGGIERDRQAFRDAIEERSAWANGTVDGARRLLDRPVSVVVGEDAPTVEAAVAEAPANTTVYVPPGTYRANVTIDRPITLRGAGNATHLRGPGNGTVVTALAPGVAVAELSITGVGNTTSTESVPGNRSGWDYSVEMGYGFGDAGVTLAGAPGSYVRNVRVETPANGVLVRWSNHSVVENATVYGSEFWADGFMGVMTMESRVVVQDSTFVGGRDGVYTHVADGSVIRDNRMEALRFGVHEMYTSDALVANNTVRRSNVGVFVMTRPEGNLVVGNDVRACRSGINVAGSASYAADNVLVDNTYGLQFVSWRSLYEHNVVAHNDVGVDSGTLIPTNRVTKNDVAGNDRPALATLGPLRVWAGNYWAGAPGRDADGDGALDRPYHPTGPVDGRVHRTAGAPTLARSPAVGVQRLLSDALPGLRPTGVIDVAPRTRPVSPGRLAAVNVSSAGRVGGERP